jgi:hypothetical protein
MIVGVDFIVNLLGSVRMSKAEVAQVRKALLATRRLKGRPPKTHCLRGHERSPENVGSRGHCLRCQRGAEATRRVKASGAAASVPPSDEQAPIRPVERPKRRASRRAVSGGLCECGHPTKIHDREGLCWHKTDGIEDCDCEAVRPVEVAA